MKGGFWCETCGSKNIGNEGQARNHLRDVHHINSISNNQQELLTTHSAYPHNLADNKIECNFCHKQWKINTNSYDNLWKHMFELAKKHKWEHKKYSLDSLEFGNIIPLLHYIDIKYGIHIGYSRGLTKKTLFMDGIAKTPSRDNK